MISDKLFQSSLNLSEKSTWYNWTKDPKNNKEVKETITREKDGNSYMSSIRGELIPKNFKKVNTHHFLGDIFEDDKGKEKYAYSVNTHKLIKLKSEIGEYEKLINKISAHISSTASYKLITLESKDKKEKVVVFRIESELPSQYISIFDGNNKQDFPGNDINAIIKSNVESKNMDILFERVNNKTIKMVILLKYIDMKKLLNS